MTPLDDWAKIRARVEALKETQRIVFGTFSDRRSDDIGAAQNVILPEADAILKAMKEFTAQWATSPGSLGIQDIVGEVARAFAKRSQQNVAPSTVPGAAYSTAILVNAAARIDFLLDAVDFRAVPIVERAFAHLQRSLIVDTALRDRWQAAFHSETECEALGAIHLLAHGIWAFKANAEGERTDLLLSGTVGPADARSTGSYLALTEWKVVRDGDDPKKKRGEAREQAQRYAQSALAGLELERTRYLILVSKKQVAVQDEVVGQITFRAINIAIERELPSVEARTTGSPQ
ncbi:MAG: hypothetical protein HYY84_20150 [Deltaproteobacteria bacterium]|nr:hypothetical protein [Deltaproteobacteria bacterium]